MKTVHSFLSPPTPCVYLPDQIWQLEYEYLSDWNAEDHLTYLNQGWRRAGSMMFRPRCPGCRACQSLRVLVEQFRPNRSQRRTAKLNENVVVRKIASPSPTPAKLELYLRHHVHHHLSKDWPETDEMQALRHLFFLAENPFPTEEWTYWIADELVAVMYVDILPDGLSGIYSFYSPEHPIYSLGTWMVLTMIERCKQMSLPFAYLGYYVRGCRSMEYKGKFRPHQLLAPDGNWVEH
jgi:arginine-tRNA-protein transferase